MKICPSCGSKRIGSFRLDSDWGHGGDWWAANVTQDYTPEDIESFDSNERPDIECSVCCVCGTCF